VASAVEVWDVNSSRLPVAQAGQPGTDCTAVTAAKGSGGWLWNASESDGPSAGG
jgi:hypothetical protein